MQSVQIGSTSIRNRSTILLGSGLHNKRYIIRMYYPADLTLLFTKTKHSDESTQIS